MIDYLLLLLDLVLVLEEYYFYLLFAFEQLFDFDLLIIFVLLLECIHYFVDNYYYFEILFYYQDFDLYFVQGDYLHYYDRLGEVFLWIESYTYFIIDILKFCLELEFDSQSFKEIVSEKVNDRIKNAGGEEFEMIKKMIEG